MNGIFKIFIIALLSMLVTGCADNVRRFRIDPSLKHQLRASNFKAVELQSVSMPKGDDNSVVCRLNSMITLPDKMKYSQYIRDAVQKSLVFINDQKDNSTSYAHKLNILLTKVEVNTLKARWYIEADVRVDNNKAIPLKTAMDHNFAYMALTACSNAASAFDEAVDNFIKQLFIHPEIAKQLK